MAAGGYTRYNIWGEPTYVPSAYWLWQAENAYHWFVTHPEMNWEQLMYFYLFKSVGYEE